MKVEYQLEPEDWGVFAEYCAKRSRSVQRSVLTLRVVGAVASAVLMTRIFSGTAMGVLAAASLAGAWWWGAPQLLYRSIRRAALNRERPCLRGRHSLETGPEGIRARCDVSESVHAWRVVRLVSGIPTHVLILVGEALGYTIPRGRVISGDLEGFMSDVSRHSGVERG